jgi:flagellar biosynthetic protein FlhB
MAEQDDSAEKEHEPTQKRLDDARERGEVARSQDLTTAATYGGLLLAVLIAGPASLRRLGEIGAQLLGDLDRLAPQMSHGAAAPVGAILLAVAWACAPFFLFPAVAALLSVLGQRALVASAQKLEPKLSRISPIATFGHKFGVEGLFEFGKSTVKLVVISVFLGLFLVARFDEIMATLALEPAQATLVLLRLSVAFLLLVLMVAAVVGVIDYLWQVARHLRRNRMTRQEMIDEFKLSEGDPHTKALRRQRGQDLAMNQMLRDVPKADVVIVNPTHYAVALKWNRADRHAPVCVAKGVDEVAARIREAAAGAGVPIRRDPPTARALYAAVAIGDEIRPEQYRAVAAAIRFAEAMRKRARARK